MLGDELLQPVLGFVSSAMASQVGMMVVFSGFFTGKSTRNWFLTPTIMVIIVVYHSS